jgi:hypothetical protein
MMSLVLRDLMLEFLTPSVNALPLVTVINLIDLETLIPGSENTKYTQSKEGGLLGEGEEIKYPKPLNNPIPPPTPNRYHISYKLTLIKYYQIQRHS